MKIAIFGGDKRMLYAGQMFQAEGFECVCYGFDKEICRNYGLNREDSIESALNDAKVVLLPLPCEKNGVLNSPFSKEETKVSRIIENMKRNTLLLGGKIPQNTENTVDYSQREDFQLYNAVPTAEGALALAMKELETTLFGSKAVITGFGRIGSCLARRLNALGADVTAVTRSRESRARAEIMGIKAVGFEGSEAPLSQADIVFNTVPFKVFGEKELKALKPDTPIMDLASLPGGADEKECASHGIKLFRALALPGKVAPKSAGEIIFKTVLSVLYERGITP